MALLALPGIGAVRARRLRVFFGSYEGAWKAGRESLAAAGAVPSTQIQAILDARKSADPYAIAAGLAEHGVTACFEGDTMYPGLLASLRDCPPVVYIRGGLEPGDSRAIAVVGTRRMSPYGRFMAARLARDLAGAGYPIVSGLARGIDGVAHGAALDCAGRTLAVLAGGLDCIYPPEHQELAARVAQQGALLSEYPPGTPTVSGNFPARNRLISGMAVATVVVEAGLRSGAMLTAAFALEQGREVFAVPGRVGDPGSAGTHALLQDGAGLVQSAADVIAGLPDWARTAAAPQGRAPAVRAGAEAAAGTERVDGVDTDGEDANGEDADREDADGQVLSMADAQRRILAMVQRGPCPEQQLIEACGAAAGLVRAALVRLEMQGFVKRLPGAIFIGGTPGRQVQFPEVAEWKGP